MLSTLHTNSAAATVTRLLDMGVEDYLLASTLSGVLAQRLVRRLCTHCSKPAPASSQMPRETRGTEPRPQRPAYEGRVPGLPQYRL